MRQILIILLFIVCASLPLPAQDQHYSGFSHTLVYSDPSYIASLSDARFSSTYRNQWPGLNNVYTTYSAALIMPAERLHSTFGLSLMHDNQAQGAILKTTLNGIYAYTVKVSRMLDVAAGLGLSYNFRSINENKLMFETDLTGIGTTTEPLNYDNYRSGYGDFSLGFTVIYNNNFFSGLSLNHVTKPRERQSNTDFNSLSRRFSFHTGGVFTLSKSRNSADILLMPGIVFQQQERYQELFYGANCMINPIIFGLWARQDLKFHFDAIVINTGISWQQYNIFYSYDVSLKSIKFFSAGMGAHEVTFLINFQYNGKRKKIGAIKCPKI